MSEMSSAVQAPLSVLVVDDDEIMRELLTALLEAEGHTITAAETIEEATAHLASGETPDVILTDLHLPGTGARELIETLRQQKAKQTPLLGMSGSQPEDGLLAQLDGFLLKPFSTEDFYEAVKRAKISDPKASHETANLKPVATISANEVPVLDMGTYNRYATSMPSALSDLYRMTLDDVAKRADAAHKAFANGDEKLCRDEGHAMKGGCSMVGALELAALGKAIEAGAPVDTSMLNEIAAASARLRRMLVTLA